MPRKILLAALTITAALTATASAKPYCRPNHVCINSWVLPPQTSQIVQSRHTIRANSSAGYQVFFNGRSMGSRGDMGAWAYFIADESVSAFLTQNRDRRRPFRVRIANFSRHPARITIKYWQR